jgi:hypothetical protein
VLTAESNYPPTCTGHPDVLAAALSYHAGVIDQLIDSDPQCTQPSMPNPSSAFTSTLSMHGTSFTMQDTCGSNTGKSREDDYSATSTTLILRATNGSFSRTYTLVP